MKPLRFAASMALVLIMSAATGTNVAGAQAQAVPPAERFELVDPAMVQPAMILPAPPVRGSGEERAELAELHALLAAATPARLAQAKADDALEDPSIFDGAAGRRLEALPATWALLRTVQNETDRTIDLAKEYFRRTRPWGIDPTLHNCDASPTGKPTRSYPSGHASLGYSTGYVLARLMPERAPQVMTRAADYALSRQYCAAHFPSDTEASHVVGTMIAAQLLADPRLAGRIAAARAELAAN